MLEYVGPKWRTFVANMSIAIFFTMAASLLPWLAYWLADWRMLCVATSAPLLIAALTPWLVPESARWLVSQGRVEEALVIMKRLEKSNGTTVPAGVYQQFEVRGAAGLGWPALRCWLSLGIGVTLCFSCWAHRTAALSSRSRRTPTRSTPYWTSSAAPGSATRPCC